MPTVTYSNKPRDLYDDIQYIASGYLQGATMSRIENGYRQRFGRSPDYGSVGMKDIKELIQNMCDEGRVLVYEEPESKETCVMCARMAVSLRKFLKLHVQKLLDKHGGEVPLSCFEAMYKDEFKRELNYHHFSLTGLDHLCQVLNLLLEEDSQGGKVIKAVGYFLRKRKRNVYFHFV